MTDYSYPVHLILSSLGHEVQPTKSVMQSGQTRCLLLYCLKDMGEGNFLPLTRDYKPLGIGTRDFFSYEDFKFLYISKDEFVLNSLWDNGDKKNWFTYSDGSTPINAKSWQRYREIIRNTFIFKKQLNSLGFSKLWGYKNNSMYKDYYNENLARFKNEV